MFIIIIRIIINIIIVIIVIVLLFFKLKTCFHLAIFERLSPLFLQTETQQPQCSDIFGEVWYKNVSQIKRISANRIDHELKKPNFEYNII